MKAGQGALLAASFVLSFGNTLAAVVFEGYSLRFDPSLADALSTGWTLMMAPDYKETLWSVQNVGFYTESTCAADSQVDLSGANKSANVGSVGEPSNAFDNDLSTTWSAGEGRFKYGGLVKYVNGPPANVKCITIDMENDGKEDRMEGSRIMFEMRKTDKSPGRRMYDVIDLKVGRNVLDLENMVCRHPEWTAYTDINFWNNGFCNPKLDSEECQYDGGDCRYSKRMPAPYIVCIVLGCLVCVAFVSCCTDGLLEQERRRKFVLKRIIQKVSRKMQRC